ncbi:myoneurin-like isoform X1 [Morone saxatilis]|uniref:myoneurin-like isoform X1 n=1 Tax=Morone saxatilis TaxID=34816 RepID=UPI0015E231F3|nr:myoneurin-like isoform X1 [Morone saxatilis]
MCSVVGCYSGRRSAQRFKLPEDPERRLEWVQFLATVNKQRFKESSWTDITICSEHFEKDCFEKLTAAQLTLKPSAVPSLSDDPEPHLESPGCVEPVETTLVYGQLETRDGPMSCCEESGLASMDSEGNPVLRGVSCSTDTSDDVVSVYGQMHPRNVNTDLIREKAALLQRKGKYVVNEKRLLQLFSCECPSCGCKLKMEKFTYGVLIILNQQCLQCEYRNQWKSQVNASVPDQHPRGGIDVTPETRQEVPTDDTYSCITGVSEIVAVVGEDIDPLEEMEESSDPDDMDSDEDWKPMKNILLPRVLQKETDGKGMKEDGAYPPLPPKHSQLCTDCGMFFNKQKPHTCEHIIKPFSCNFCGKRCVSEVALTSHSRIHDENYEHPCKYCQSTFKTKVDKHTHEQIHLSEGKPYKCPDCPETFATSKERRIHLEDHRGPQQLKCEICGIEFLWPLSLQRHLTVHTGAKPFKCSVCQRGFKQASHLKSHMRLHTGERPYKCQHCDKCFNHNVSLKSHVQRYHSSKSGREQKTEKRKEKESDAADAEGNGNKRGADSGNAEEEHDMEEEEQKERIYRPKKRKKTTGRPIGRPKSYESDNVALDVQVEGQCSNRKAEKRQAQKSKKTQRSDEFSEDQRDEFSEDQPSDSDMSFDSAEEEEEMSEKAIKNTARSRNRPKTSNSDSDFDPEERKEKRSSSQNSGRGSGRRRGRPRKNLVV